MSTSSIPHPTDATYAAAYSKAWTEDPDHLVDYFAEDGTYTDVAMSGTYRGRDGIQRFHRWMLKFSPDSVIDFSSPAVQEDRLYLEWTWSGSIDKPLRLPSGQFVDAAGRHFSVTGIAACRFDSHGKLTSHRDFWDVGLLVEQIGHQLGVVATANS